MTSNMSWQKIKASRWLSTIVLLPLLAVWLIFTDGLISGGRQFLGFAFLVALMVFSLRATISLWVRMQVFDWLQWALLAFAALYITGSFAFQWPAIWFLAFVGLASGTFIGLILSLTLPRSH